MLAQLTITLNDDRSVEVNGPVNDLLMSYGLLETAKDIIREHVKKNAALVVPGTNVPRIGNGR